MPRTDYENAWRELGEWISTAEKRGRPKTGFGRAEIAEKMVELQARNVVPEGLIETAARVYGLSKIAEANPAPEARSSAARPEAEASAIDDPGPSTNQEVHDGSTARRRDKVAA